MSNQLAQIKWGRVVLTTIAVYVLSIVGVFIIVTGYASFLAFQARGAPDQALINAFANQTAPWIGPISLILFTVLGARHMAGRVENTAQLHGIILGILVSLVNIIFEGARAFGFDVLLTTVLIIVAGWLGSKLTAKK